MALSTATAILGSAIVGAGAGALSNSSATNKAKSASQYATDASTQLQRETLAAQQGNTAVARAAGDSAIQQLMSRLGISSATGATGAQGATSPLFSQPGGKQTNWDAVMADLSNRPDVIAAVNDPNYGYNGSTPQERLADWYARDGQRTGYKIPEAAITAAPKPQTDVNLSPAAQVPTYTRPDSIAAPSAYVPKTYEAPTYERPEYTDTLDVSYEDYLASPEAMAADFDANQQSGALGAALGASGALKSGAAAKRLQEIGQSSKIKGYAGFRDYTTNQYNTDRARTDALWNFDTSLKAQLQQAYDQLNSGNALAAANLARSDYQYQQGRADQNFNSDRAYGTDLALANRQYETGRYDNATNALFNLANLGQGAASQYGNALQNSANASSNALFSNAANTGNAAIASANSFNNLLGQGLNALSSYYGRAGTTSSTTPKAGLFGATSLA